jgi:transposase
MTSAVELPNDVEALKALVLKLQNSNIELAGKLTWAEEKLRVWELRYFGRKAEKVSPAEEKQNRLFDEAEANADESGIKVTEKVTVPAHERAKRGRKPKTDRLPTIEVIHDLNPEERSCPCCGEARPEIGEERSSEYDLVPAHVRRIEHVRKKYGPCACSAFQASGTEPIKTAAGPAKIVKGSDFTNRSIAFFLTAKYADAIPFHRMTRLLDRAGLVTTRATLCNLAQAVGRSIGDLIEAMNRDIAASPVMLMDETTVQVLKSGEGPPGKSYMWAAVGFCDGKPIHRFAYHKSRAGSFADSLLKGFRGYLQTDGYSGYDHLDGNGDIVHVGCFAHIRRRFVEAWEVAGKTGAAREAIDLIAKIYAADTALRREFSENRIDAAGFLAQRSEQLSPLFSELRDWLMAKSLQVTPQSKLGVAINYAMKQWDKAVRFIERPELAPDTNRVENAIRHFVVGRKNWLFSGSPQGAHTSAGLYSLIETAKANGHEPFAYLNYLFDTLPICTTQDEKEALLPYRLDPSSYSVDVE